MSIRVLHLSLSHGGGIITAMETYIQNSPSVEHFLIANVDESCTINFSEGVKISKVYNVNLNFSGVVAIYTAFKEVKPTHIHLHSSHAGAVGRLLFPFFKNIIYTPHCYAFERTDVSYFVNKLFFSIEWLLSLKPTLVAGCSPREVDLGNRLGLSRLLKNKENVFLTNYSVPQKQWLPEAIDTKTVVMVGRICPQKDPKFFVDTYNELSQLDNSIKFVWLGGGGNEEVLDLESNGISCTGWLTKDKLLEQLRSSALYFHCAAWEGNPMSVLEAAAIGMPITGRRISSLESIGLTTLADTPKECAILINQYFNGENQSILTQFEPVNNLCSADNQKAALNRIYKL
jgi:glycosyltransferase involved in cell wall biosynthesis